MFRILVRASSRWRRVPWSVLRRQFVSFALRRPGLLRQCQPLPLVLFLSYHVAQCRTPSNKLPQVANEEILVLEADELHEAGELLQIYDLLQPHHNSFNPDVLWRLTRAARDVSRLPDTSKQDKKRLAYEALEYSKKAIQHGPNDFACHKWFGIALSEVGDYEGTKAKILNAYIIREHFMRAIELNPSDSMSHYLLGMWCFTIADMPWYLHKIAAALFATPPTSTYEEALEHFKLAEENSPNFLCDNQLMLGKTLLRLGLKEEAQSWLRKTLEHKPYLPEDTKSQHEAKKLLQGL